MSSGPCITLASYNMHKAVGLDGRRDPLDRAVLLEDPLAIENLLAVKYATADIQRGHCLIPRE